MSNKTQNKEFQIVKFEVGNILLVHRASKKAFQYFQAAPNVEAHHHITHPYLARPIIYNNGLLYPKGISTLQNELENRRRAHNLNIYTEDEIANTFFPLLQCISHLHQKGIIHGCISPTNIIITEEEQIKIKDWLTQSKENQYYFHKKRKQISKEDDIIALGQIMIQAITLRKGNKLFSEKQLNNVLETIINNFSKGFVFAIAIIIKKNRERFDYLLNYLKNQERFLGDIELNGLYENIKREKEKKNISMTEMENIIQNTNIIKPSTSVLTESPLKKGTPNSSLASTAKRIKEDNQNKKTLNEDIKKKQIQKINKIIERSNEFVNELMARKNNDQILKKIIPKSNVGNNSVYIGQNSQKKKLLQSPGLSSPSKKIRTSSKKK